MFQYMNHNYNDWKKLIEHRYENCSCKEVWARMIFFIKDGTAYPMLKEILEAPFLSILRIRTALVMAAALILPGKFTQLVRFLSKLDLHYVYSCHFSIQSSRFSLFSAGSSSLLAVECLPRLV